MQGISGGGGGNRPRDPTSTQLAALTTGTLSSGIRRPIMGPPMITRSLSGSGPQSAIRSRIGVPNSTSKLRGWPTLPATVTMREISGWPSAIASKIAYAVPTLKHCTP